MATRRSPPASAAISTPVRIGRRLVGAGAPGRPGAAPRRTPRPAASPGRSAGSGSRGNSSAGMVRMRTAARPARCRPRPRPRPTITAPGRRAAHGRSRRRAGRDDGDAVAARPTPWLGQDRECRGRCRSGAAVAGQLEADAAQHGQRAAPAGHGTSRRPTSASTSTSRSHRNFTRVLAFLMYWIEISGQ